MKTVRLTESELINVIKKSILNENIEFISPVGKVRVNSKYGPRNIGGNASRNHKGVDLNTPVGTPIRSPFDGEVIDAKFKNNACGGVIYVKHDNGYRSRYCHCSKINVTKGQRVESGDIIGLTGGKKGAFGSGNSMGPHLHFEFYNGRKVVNPQFYFDFSSGVALNKVDTTSLETDNLPPKLEIAKLDSQNIDTIISNGDNSLVFRKGSKGRGVQEIQNILLDLGYKLPRFGADSDFGGETKSAVIEFQRDNGLSPDGIVGINTAKKLREKSGGLKISEGSLVEMIQRIITEKKKRKSKKKKKKGNTLCARGKRAAQAKFEVYPSAYANGYAVQVCKGTMPGLDGKKKCSGKYCSGKK